MKPMISYFYFKKTLQFFFSKVLFLLILILFLLFYFLEFTMKINIKYLLFNFYQFGNNRFKKIYSITYTNKYVSVTLNNINSDTY